MYKFENINSARILHTSISQHPRINYNRIALKLNRRSYPLTFNLESRQRFPVQSSVRYDDISESSKSIVITIYRGSRDVPTKLPNLRWLDEERRAQITSRVTNRLDNAAD